MLDTVTDYAHYYPLAYDTKDTIGDKDLSTTATPNCTEYKNGYFYHNDLALNNYTLSFWIKFTNNDQMTFLLQKDAENPSSNLLHIYKSDTQIVCYARLEQTTANYIFPMNTYVYMTISSDVKYNYIYINNTHILTHTGSGWDERHDFGPAITILGHQYGDLIGSAKYLRIYNRLISSSERKIIYDYERARIDNERCAKTLLDLKFEFARVMPTIPYAIFDSQTNIIAIGNFIQTGLATFDISSNIQATCRQFPQAILNSYSNIIARARDYLKNYGSGNDAVLSGDYTILTADNHAIALGATGQADTRFKLPADVDWILIEVTDVNGIDNDIGQHIWSTNLNRIDDVRNDLYLDPQVSTYNMRAMIYTASTSQISILEGDQSKIFYEWTEIDYVVPTSNWIISQDSLIPIYEPRFAGELEIDNSRSIKYYAGYDGVIVKVNEGVNLTFMDKASGKIISSSFHNEAGTYGFDSDTYYAGHLKFWTNDIVTLHNCYSNAYWNYQTVFEQYLYRGEDLLNIDNFAKGNCRTKPCKIEITPGAIDKVTSAVSAFSYCADYGLDNDFSLSMPELLNASSMFSEWGNQVASLITYFYAPKLQNMTSMFSFSLLDTWPDAFGITNNCTSLNNWAISSNLLSELPPGGVDTSNVTDFSSAFLEADLDLWLPELDFSSASNLTETFRLATSTKDLTISLPVATNITSMFYDFKGSYKTLDINIPNVTTANSAFAGNTSYGGAGFQINKLIIRNPDNITNCSGIFCGTNQYLTSYMQYLEIDGILHISGEDGRYLFRGTKLKSYPDKANLDLSNVTDLQRAFSNTYYEGEELPMDFNFSKVINSNYTWSYCKATKMPIGVELNFPAVQSTNGTFANTKIKAVGDVTIPVCTDARNMFADSEVMTVGKVVVGNDCDMTAMFGAYNDNVAKIICIGALDTTKKKSYTVDIFYRAYNLVAPTVEEQNYLNSEEGYVYVNPNICGFIKINNTSEIRMPLYGKVSINNTSQIKLPLYGKVSINSVGETILNN